jgi:hypothetical protein
MSISSLAPASSCLASARYAPTMLWGGSDKRGTFSAPMDLYMISTTNIILNCWEKTQSTKRGTST